MMEIQELFTGQIPFELTDIQYNQIKYQIAKMVRVKYNTVIGRNVMNEDDIEDFVNIQ